jgi:hypothetical protein
VPVDFVVGIIDQNHTHFFLIIVNSCKIRRLAFVTQTTNGPQVADAVHLSSVEAEKLNCVLFLILEMPPVQSDQMLAGLVQANVNQLFFAFLVGEN